MPAATTARDPRVTRAARLLRDEAARREEGAFVVDGEDLLVEAVRAGIEVEWVLAAEPPAWVERLGGAPRAGGGAGAGGAAASRGAAPPQVAAAGPDALRALAAVGQPPSVVAVCRIPQPPAPPALPPRSLVLARVTNPGNVGSIVRTAAALGLPRVSLTPGSADPWSRPALRAAKGATFARGLVATEWALVGERRPRAATATAPLAAALPRGGVHPADLPPDASIVLGSERDGLTAEERAACDLAVTIPAPNFESLNVAAAAAILAWELSRRA